jgi:Domain of unknown function (DUF1707)
MTEERPGIRIGTAERNAAMKALDEHLAAGRLQVEEYGERSAIAANAVTAPELAALFDDLPAPHPELPGVPGPPPATTPSAVPSARAEPTGLQVWGPRLLVLTPLLAVALFLLTRQWVFFLLIPAVGMAFGSRHRGHGDLRHGGHQGDGR